MDFKNYNLITNNLYLYLYLSLKPKALIFSKTSRMNSSYKIFHIFKGNIHFIPGITIPMYQ